MEIIQWLWAKSLCKLFWGFFGAVFCGIWAFCGCFCYSLRTIWTPTPVESSFPNVHEIHKISGWIWHLQVPLFRHFVLLQGSWFVLKIMLHSLGVFEMQPCSPPHVQLAPGVCAGSWIVALEGGGGSGAITAGLPCRVSGFMGSIFAQCFAMWDTREIFQIFCSLPSFSCLFLGFGLSFSSRAFCNILHY